jgi:hypothetical protein
MTFFRNKSSLTLLFVIFWIVTLATVLSFVIARPALADKTGTAMSKQFTLTKGRGIAVCEAYLKRLNLVQSDEPPYCDRPEDTEIEGFEHLNRIPLNIDEAFAFGDKVYNFTYRGSQDSFPNGRSSITKNIIQQDLGRSILAWRYDPPADIDNDGAPDSLVIWQGYGASHGSYVCGSVKDRDPWWQNQIAYIVDFDAMRIDEKRTRKIFGHPVGSYSSVMAGKRKVTLPGFRPIGLKMGIFKYDGLYYFDTFFDSSGDFQGRRQKDPRIGSTLGVFLRKDGVTKQMCEYRFGMTDAKTK